MTDLLVAVAPAGVGLKTSDIGVTVQAFSARLTNIAALAVTDGNFIVGNGANWVVESGATARASLGLGTAALNNTGDFATAAQGTLADGALQPGDIGVSVQAYSGNLDDIAALTPGAPEDGYAITWDDGAGAFVLAAAGAALPVVDETPLLFKTGDPTITQTHDIDAYSVARVVTWPNAAGTVPLLNVAQTFSADQTFSAAVNINTVNGIDVNPGSDADADLITVGVTGAPRIFWDESETTFAISNANVTNNDEEFIISMSAGVEALYKLRDADVVHPFTGIGGVYSTVDANTSGVLAQSSGIRGGVVIGGFRDTAGNAFLAQGHSNGNTTTSPVLLFNGFTTDGGTGRANLPSTAFLFSVGNGTSTFLLNVFGDGTTGINTGTSKPTGMLHIDQSSLTGAIPVLTLDQADLSEEFIRFVSTVGAGNPIDTAALGAYYGKARVYVEGVGAKWIALYD